MVFPDGGVSGGAICFLCGRLVWPYFPVAGLWIFLGPLLFPLLVTKGDRFVSAWALLVLGVFSFSRSGGLCGLIDPRPVAAGLHAFRKVYFFLIVFMSAARGVREVHQVIRRKRRSGAA